MPDFGARLREILDDKNTHQTLKHALIIQFLEAQTERSRIAVLATAVMRIDALEKQP